MSERKLPTAFGILRTDPAGAESDRPDDPNWSWWVDIYDDRETAEEEADEISCMLDRQVTVVELIPREEADRMVADAVAAERERCAGILEDEARCDEMSGFHGKAAIFREFASKIREVTE